MWMPSGDLSKNLRLGPGVAYNLSEHNDRVVVLYTLDDEQHPYLAYDFDVSALENANYLRNDDDDDENNDENDEEEADGGPRRKRKRSKLASDEGPDDDDEDPVRVYRKLKKEYYHMGTFHEKPSGCSTYELSQILRKNTRQLWLACISHTDQFVRERLTGERYKIGVMELEHQYQHFSNLDSATSVSLKDGAKVRAPEVFRISYEDEPRLMLLQEWNLFDSMMCSSYIATK